VLGALLLGLLVDDLFGLPRIEFDALHLIGGVISVLGAGLVASGILGFLRAGNDPEPWKRDAVFVSSGLYRFTRNPMYLGMVLVQLGVACFAQSIGGLLSVPLAILLIDRFVIAREERHLRATFGEQYSQYCQRVRRWI